MFVRMFNHNCLLNRFRVKPSWFGLVLMILFVDACKVDDELLRLKKTQWTPDVVLPLVNADLSIEDLLLSNNGGLFFLDDNNKVLLSYEGVVASKYGYEIISFIDSRLELLSGQNRLSAPLLDQYIIE